MSILTSLYPSFHKVNRISVDRLDSETLTLAEALYNRGYRTWAITGGGQVSSDYGFSEGFESYMEFTSAEDDVRKKVVLTREFMDENRESPVFPYL
jgi:arylsulfatase A-like enzyme